MSAVKLNTTLGSVTLVGEDSAGSATVTIPKAGVGKVLQVQQAVKTDTFSTTSTSFIDITDLGIAITPKSTTSKILVEIVVHGSSSSGGAVRILRDSTPIAIGTSATGSRVNVTSNSLYDTNTDTGRVLTNKFIDSPATISEVVYKIQGITNAGTLYVNRSINDTDVSYNYRAISTITVTEIGA